LSPELLNHYRRREVNPKYDVYRADVYSLGMTLLQAATLRDPETKYYDWPNEKILHKKIQDALLNLENDYSRELVDTIRQMLEEDEYSRPDFLGLSGVKLL
jgi:serine/threonine protein kinase